jgi:hypothetical protein
MASAHASPTTSIARADLRETAPSGTQQFLRTRLHAAVAYLGPRLATHAHSTFRPRTTTILDEFRAGGIAARLSVVKRERE